jgi:chromosome segregation protein
MTEFLNSPERRVDRLFGVTMAERGVSQLVSVDLQTAEQLVA